MIEYDFQVLLHVLRGLASRLIMAANHIDCRAQPGARCGFAPQGDYSVKRVEQQALARSRDMRKETTLNQMVLRTRARVVRHANFHPNLVGQQLQIMLEDIGVRGIAAAAIAQPEDRRRLGITPLAHAVPRPAKTVTRKLAGVVRQADVDLPTVADSIVNTVRNQHAVGPTGTIMLEGAKRLAAADAPGLVAGAWSEIRAARGTGGAPVA